MECAYCGKELNRKVNSKCKLAYCNRECMTLYRRKHGTWNKGKKWEEMYSEEVYNKLYERNHARGENNQNWKRKRPDLSERNKLNNPHKLELIPSKFYAYQRKAYELYGKKCAICGRTDGQIDVHHKDHNHRNNKIENLMVLCASCHGKYHKGTLKL